jgi:hypothetical protein
MQGIEVKFLFEGVIFSSIVNMFRVSDSINSYEFSINFLSNYLAKKYSGVYFLVFENNRFKPVYTQNEKEQELIKSLQDALLRLPGIIKQKFMPDHNSQKENKKIESEEG